MIILEYKLEASDKGMVAPSWIVEGGAFYNPANHTVVGVIPDDTPWHIPPTVVRLTTAELEARVLSIHNAGTPMLLEGAPEAPRELTEEEVITRVRDWVASREQGE